MTTHPLSNSQLGQNLINQAFKDFFYGSPCINSSSVYSFKSIVSEYLNSTAAWLLDSLTQTQPTDPNPASELPSAFVNSVSATVAFAGSYSGSVSIHCPAALAELLAGRMTGLESVKEYETTNDALGELANVLAGEIKLVLSTGGLDIQLSMPVIVSGSHYSLSMAQHNNTATTAWQIEGLPFQVSLIADRNLLLSTVVEELRCKREWLSLALEGGGLGLWNWELATGSAQYSDEWASMLGYSVDDLLPEIATWESLTHPQDMVAAQQALQQHLSGTNHFFEAEIRMFAKNCTWRWILVRGRVVELHEDGTPLRIAGSHLDITDRKAAELALDESKKQLELLNASLEHRVTEELRKNREKDGMLLHQDKLASIGQLAAGVAHEINNPMGFIMANLNTLKEYMGTLQQYFQMVDEKLPEPERSELQQTRKELDLDYILDDLQPLLAESTEGAERVRRIVLDLKDFARSDKQEMYEADLNQLVQSTLNIVRNELRYVARLDLHLGKLPHLLCHPQQINQVISNLLINAAHAIEHQGVITVSTWQENGFVLLSIADTGIGIPPELLSRIFDPFFTTKEVGKGTGLGLSISYDVIKKHGGEITVESETGVGTTFIVKLPIAAPFAK